MVARTGPVLLAHSAIGSVGEKLVGEPGGQTVDRADAQLPPWTERDEVRAALAGTRAFGRHLTPDGSAMLLTLAEPLPGGGARYLLTGSHRGIRRLVLVRKQLLELVVYEIVLALPLVAVFAVGLVRPLEKLGAAARRYPAAPLADPKLYARRDEIGALARTLTDMAEDLDTRRRAAAELGADIAHEFKNPLATIAASAELLVTSPALTPERVDLCARSITESVDRLRRSIDDLMGLLRLEQAIAAEAREPVAYGAFLDGAHRRIPPRPARRRVHVRGRGLGRRRGVRAAAQPPPLAGAAAQPGRQRAGAAGRRPAHRARRARRARRAGDHGARLRPRDLGRKSAPHLSPLLHAAAAGRAAGHGAGPVDRRERGARPRRARRGEIRRRPGKRRRISRHAAPRS